MVDDDQRLIGWLDKNAISGQLSIRQVMDEKKAEEIALHQNASLREALSRMLGLGVRSIPVVDDRQRLLGEISMAEIEAITHKGEAGNAATQL